MTRKYILNGAKVPNLPGVKIEGDAVVFDGYSEKQIDRIRKMVAAGGREEVAAPIRKLYEPTDADKAKVLQIVGDEDRTKEFLYVRTIAAETLVDSTFDKFTKAFLERMAAKYAEGRSVVDSHDTRKRIGRTFDAEVIPHPEKAGEYQLIVKFYLSPSTENGKQAINEVKDGIVDRVSVSFRPDYEAVTFYDEGQEGSPDPTKSFWLIDAGDPEYEQVIELSLVAMGAQPGAKFKGENARVTSMPTFGAEDIHKTESEMDLKEIKYTIGGTEKSAKVTEDGAKAISGLVDEINAKDAEVSKLKADLKVFHDKEAEAKSALVDELVNLKKQAFGEDAIDAKEETDVAKSFSTDYLSKEIDRLKAAVKSKADKQLDPNGNPKPKKKEDDDKKESKPGTFLDI